MTEFNQPLVLHSDSAPMKSVTLKAKMEELGITPSYNRPRVSNDNPFSESLFRTLKYRPNWPSHGFDSLEVAREWVDNLVNWYNDEHKHSRIKFFTPSERHQGLDGALLASRRKVLAAAKKQNLLQGRTISSFVLVQFIIGSLITSNIYILRLCRFYLC